MSSYIVIELQTNAQGSVSNVVWAYADENQVLAENQAFSKYHAVLSAAAVSAVPVHSCVILRNDGTQIAGQAYQHIEEPTPEAE